jgi:hypothetical protein|tara:strand:+ start:604 stop:789 length:186 start_codon:yes stop_codon:yes gene_type:complete
MDEKTFLLNMLQLLDLSCKRGAWSGSEIKALSGIREEIMLRLKPLMPEEEEEEGKEEKNVE